MKARTELIICSISSTSASMPSRSRSGTSSSAEAQPRQRRAQIVADGADHRGAVIDKTSQPALHAVEGAGGAADFGGTFQRQHRGGGIASQLFGGIGKAGDGTHQTAGEEQPDRRHQAGGQEEPEQQAALPAVGEGFGLRLHHRPLPVRQPQGGDEIAFHERRLNQTEQALLRGRDQNGRCRRLSNGRRFGFLAGFFCGRDGWRGRGDGLCLGDTIGRLHHRAGDPPLTLARLARQLRKRNGELAWGNRFGDDDVGRDQA